MKNRRIKKTMPPPPMPPPPRVQAIDGRPVTGKRKERALAKWREHMIKRGYADIDQDEDPLGYHSPLRVVLSRPIDGFLSAMGLVWTVLVWIIIRILIAVGLFLASVIITKLIIP